MFRSNDIPLFFNNLFRVFWGSLEILQIKMYRLYSLMYNTTSNHWLSI